MNRPGYLSHSAPLSHSPTAWFESRYRQSLLLARLLEEGAELAPVPDGERALLESSLRRVVSDAAGMDGEVVDAVQDALAQLRAIDESHSSAMSPPTN